MKKILMAMMLALTMTSQAGTVYRDRYLPAGAPCMIDFGGNTINAMMIKEIIVARYRERTEYNLFTADVFREYNAVRIYLINGHYYQIESDKLDVLNKEKESTLAKIKACRG
jgi:hypothetical protein